MATSTKKILVVDDEDDIRVYLSRLFQENGFLVNCASNVEEALLAVEKERPDLITLDVSMPEASGGKFYRDVKSRPELSSIPIVFVTGVTGPGGSRDTEHFYGSRSHLPPPDGFIAKPIDREEIIALAKKLTGGAAAGASAN
jgi:CheY-like chemotaxis protein